MFEEKCKRLLAKDGIRWVQFSHPGEDVGVRSDGVVASLFLYIPDGETWKLERDDPEQPGMQEVIYVTRRGMFRLAFSYTPGHRVVKSLGRLVRSVMRMAT